jgi:hypothetical protein
MLFTTKQYNRLTLISYTVLNTFIYIKTMNQAKKPAPGPVRQLGPSEIARLGERYQPRGSQANTPIPCTGNAIRYEFGQEAIVISDHKISGFLQKDRESGGKYRLSPRIRSALIELRIQLSQKGAESFSDAQKVKLYGLMSRKPPEPITPEERERRNTLIRVFFTYHADPRKCDSSQLNDFFTPELIESLVREVSDILRPYGLDGKKARSFIHGCGIRFLEECDKTIRFEFENVGLTPSILSKTLFSRFFNPQSSCYVFHDRFLGQDKLFLFSEIPELLRCELNGVPHSASEEVIERMNWITNPGRVRTVSGGAPGSGKGGSSGHK